MASLQERLLPYANGNANMAITYNEDGSVKKRKGDKKAVAMIKRVGEPISLREATDALHVIKKTSGGNPLREELRRKRLFKNNPIDVNM